MIYQTLKAGDIRQPGDEWKNKSALWPTSYREQWGQTKDWTPVYQSRLGEPILSTDLTNAEFRRPCK